MGKNGGTGYWIVCHLPLSVLINGSPSSKFKPHRGLRQGDPLSPFLFNINVVEALNILLERARACGMIRGVKVGEMVWCSHFQFADDTILFYNNDKEEILNLKRTLRYFQLFSGLKFDFSKSMLCGIKVQDKDIMINLAQFWAAKKVLFHEISWHAFRG